jgi:translation initiation factor 6
MHLFKTNFNGNPNIGLLGIATDEYCIIGSRLAEKTVRRIAETLKVPVICTEICGTELIGVFCAANSKCLLLPKIAFESELKTLDRHKINYEIISTKHTALGNNILSNDFGCLVSKKFGKTETNKIEKALGVKATKATINKLDIIGSAAALNTRGCLVHEDIKDGEKDLIERTLNIICGTGTVNMGSPFIKAGIIVNSNGLIISSNSGNPEVLNADEILGFIENGR